MLEPHAARPDAARGQLALAGALYATLAGLTTWPLAAELGAAVPLGTDTSATVPFASAWALWWTSDRALEGLAGLWDAPIFWPEAGVFATSEPILGLGIVAAPLLWAGVSASGALGSLVLLALTLNGVAARGLLLALGARSAVALAGGAMVVTLPYTHLELGVLALVPLCGVLWTLQAAIALARGPSAGRGATLGAAFALTFAMCGQYALFLALAAAPAGLWLVERDHLGWPAARALMLACVVAAPVVLPIGLAQQEVNIALGYERSVERATRGSLGGHSLGRTPWQQLVPTPGIEADADAGMRSLYPGTVKVSLALGGALWLLRRRRGRERRELAFLMTFGALGLALAFGPRLGADGVGPYPWLREVVPGLAQVRSPWRVAGFAQLVVALLAALALEPLRVAAAGRKRMVAGVLVVAVLATVELWPRDQRLAPAPNREAHTSWLTFLEATPAGEPLAHLPMPGDKTAGGHEQEARRMVLQAWHGRPLVNGYSSYFPDSFRALTRDTRGFPDGRSHRALWKRGVRHVTVAPSWLATRAPLARGRWQEVFRDEAADLAVLALRPPSLVRKRAERR